MEIGTITGFVAGTIVVIISLFMSADYDAVTVLGIIDPPSIMITIGGTICASFISYPLPKLLSAMKAASNVFKTPVFDPAQAIGKIIELANLARKEGLLALEEAAGRMEDAFMQKGIMLIVDGTDPELVRSILETELTYIDSRHGDIRGVWEFLAGMAPAWGMIGTLIGLIMMLQNMSDPNALGPKMAIALVTTFYGSMIANFIANPIANKMKVFSNEEMLMKEVLIEGMLSIQAGENPRIIEEKLKSFLSPALRNNQEGSGDKGGAGEAGE